MANTIMGMAPKKAVVHVLMIGGGAAITKVAGDAIGDRLFTQTAAEATSSPRSVDDQKKYQLYRGLAVAAGGLLVGKLLWSKSKDLAFAIAAGAMVSGVDRILTVYDYTRQIQNWFRSSDNQLPAPAANTVPAYNAGYIAMTPRSLPRSRHAEVGPMVSRVRERDSFSVS